MWNSDSTDKIIRTYFSSVTRKPFTYKGKVFAPRLVKASPLVLRGMTCPSGCGGCCQVASLDWLPGENPAYPVPTRLIEFDGRQVPIQSDTQDDNDDKYCKNRSPVDGRCGIHKLHPLSCDFECVKFFISKNTNVNTLTNLPFPRKWSYTRVDGGKGGLCESLPVTADTMKDVIRRMYRLQDWTNHFQLETCIPEIIEWMKTGPHTEVRYFNTDVATSELASMSLHP